MSVHVVDQFEAVQSDVKNAACFLGAQVDQRHRDIVQLGPVGQTGDAIGVGEFLDPQNVLAQLDHHSAERGLQVTHLARCISFQIAVEVTGCGLIGCLRHAADACRCPVHQGSNHRNEGKKKNRQDQYHLNNLFPQNARKLVLRNAHQHGPHHFPAAGNRQDVFDHTAVSEY